MNQIISFLDAALSQIYAPYIWGGKGDKQFRDDPIKGMGIYPHNFGRNVFDCAGLVMWASLQAGGVERRGEFSAGVILNRFPPTLNEWEPGVLRLYPQHVSIVLCPGIIIEASGGNHLTLSPTPAGRVRVGKERRIDFIAARRMAFNL